MRREKTAERLLKRILAAGIDGCLLGMVLFLTAFGYVQLFGLNGEEYQGISFLVILAILMPVEVFSILLVETGPLSAVIPFYMLLFLQFLVEWGTLCVQEIVFSGQTVGKMCMGLCIVHLDGTPVRFSNVIVRNLVKVVSRYMLLLPMATVFFTAKQRALHDLIGKSYVVELT